VQESEFLQKYKELMGT